MKTYNEYKDSGVQWIGQIPKHWDRKRIKFVCKEVFPGATPSTSNKDFWDGNIPWIPSGSCHDCNINEAPKFITEFGLQNSSTRLIPAYTTVIALTGATCAQLGYLTFDSCSNQSVVAFIESKKKAYSKFLFYALMAARESILLNQTGGAQSGINVEDCKNIVLVFPPLAEQQAIADYLDHRCAELDTEIDDRKKQIKLLEELKQAVITKAVTQGLNPSAPLKDSGVLYLGKVPAHWTIMPLKRICRNEKYCIKTGPFGSQLKGEDFKPDGDVKVYNQRNVIDNQFEVVQSYVTKEKAKELSSFLTKSNDVLISSRGTIGKAALLPERCKMGILHPCLIALRINEKIFSTRNLIYMFNYSLTFKDYLYLESNATTIDVIYTETIKRLKLPVPPLAEQQAIADYLDAKTAEIDEQINLQNEQIHLLEELKQSIISQAVTGKICVTD